MNYFVKHLMVDEEGEFSKSRSRKGQQKNLWYLRGMMKVEVFQLRVRRGICFLVKMVKKNINSLKSKKKAG